MYTPWWVLNALTSSESHSPAPVKQPALEWECDFAFGLSSAHANRDARPLGSVDSSVEVGALAKSFVVELDEDVSHGESGLRGRGPILNRQDFDIAAVFRRLFQGSRLISTLSRSVIVVTPQMRRCSSGHRSSPEDRRRSPMRKIRRSRSRIDSNAALRREVARSASALVSAASACPGRLTGNSRAAMR